jgi:hypothetical protein
VSGSAWQAGQGRTKQGKGGTGRDRLCKQARKGRARKTGSKARYAGGKGSQASKAMPAGRIRKAVR